MDGPFSMKKKETSRCGFCYAVMVKVAFSRAHLVEELCPLRAVTERSELHRVGPVAHFAKFSFRREQLCRISQARVFPDPKIRKLLTYLTLYSGKSKANKS